MIKILELQNFRRGSATNSSSTHSIIYKSEKDLYEDLNANFDFYGRYDEYIIASKSMKIKYIANNIQHRDKLFEIMSQYYPEMLQHIKTGFNTSYNRGSLFFDSFESLEPNIDFLRRVIEDNNIVIVGGSDELDFFYDQIENKLNLTPYYINPNFLFKNGNYWVLLESNNPESFRLRFSSFGETELIPEYPELIDLKITNNCNHNCKFCYQGSNHEGKHASFKTIESILYPFKYISKEYYPYKIEFAIGGGNILLHPELDKIFKYIHDSGHIINTTITARDCEAILRKKEFTDLFYNYVNGIGISVSNIEDLKYLSGFSTVMRNNKQLTLHLIPELLEVDKTKEIIRVASNVYGIYDTLFLGYKRLGRALTNNIDHFILSEEDLDNLFTDRYGERLIYNNIDTSFANTYYNYLKDNFYIHRSLTTLEGEFSMYIDAVEGKAYKSSYHLDKPYSLYTGENVDHKYSISSLEAFRRIREDADLSVKTN